MKNWFQLLATLLLAGCGSQNLAPLEEKQQI